MSVSKRPSGYHLLWQLWMKIGARQESLMEHVICKKRQATEKEGDEDEDEDEDDEESHTK